MARPKVAPETRVVGVRLTVDVYEAWAATAVKKGTSVGALLRVKLTEACPSRKT